MTGTMLLVTAGNEKSGHLYVLSFDGFFDVVDKLSFGKRPFRVRRLLNSDYFFVSTKTDLHLVHLVKGTLYNVYSLLDVVKDSIENFVALDYEVVVTHQQGRAVTVVQFPAVDLDNL